MQDYINNLELDPGVEDQLNKILKKHGKAHTSKVISNTTLMKKNNGKIKHKNHNELRYIILTLKNM